MKRIMHEPTVRAPRDSVPADRMAAIVRQAVREAIGDQRDPGEGPGVLDGEPWRSSTG
jgi:hypothetical protein